MPILDIVYLIFKFKSVGVNLNTCFINSGTKQMLLILGAVAKTAIHKVKFYLKEGTRLINHRVVFDLCALNI